MPIQVGTNSYATEDELQAYALARGVTLAQAAEVLLIKAMDWLEVQPFAGYKASADQPLEFPRRGRSSLDGFLQAPDGTVPERIKTAQLSCALLYNSGVDPLNPDPLVTREKIGPLDTEYKHAPAGASRFKRLQGLIAPLVVGSQNISRG